MDYKKLGLKLDGYYVYPVVTGIVTNNPDDLRIQIGIKIDTKEGIKDDPTRTIDIKGYTAIRRMRDFCDKMLSQYEEAKIKLKDETDPVSTPENEDIDSIIFEKNTW